MPSPPRDNPATTPTRPHRTVIAAHLIHTLYGHWAVNDPRGEAPRASEQVISRAVERPKPQLFLVSWCLRGFESLRAVASQARFRRTTP